MSLIETLRSPSPRRQLLVAGAGAVVLGLVLIAAYFLILRKPYDALFTNLRTMDAATIVAQLDKKHIPYRLADHGATIRVPRDVVDNTRLSVMSEDLPIKGTVGFELFNKSDMGLTEFAQQINYQRALQGELARTIMTLDAVDSARIHLSFSEPTIFRDDRRPPKASVTIVTRAGKTLAPDTVGGLQRLVAAAVPELAAADVVVLDAGGRVVSSEVAETNAAPAGAPQRRAIEEFYAAKVRQSIEAVLPGRQFDVAVSAEQPGSSSSEGLNAAFARWSPASRKFSLAITVASDPPLASSDEARARDAAGEAVGLDAAIGDVVTVTAKPAPGPAPAPASDFSKTRAPPSRLPLWALVAAPVVLLALFAIAALVQRRARRPLSVLQRRRYVRRIESLLAEGTGDAAANT